MFFTTCDKIIWVCILHLGMRKRILEAETASLHDELLWFCLVFPTEVWTVVFRVDRLSQKHFWTTCYFNLPHKIRLQLQLPRNKQNRQLKYIYLWREMVTKVSYRCLNTYTYPKGMLKCQKWVLGILLEVFS